MQNYQAAVSDISQSKEREVAGIRADLEAALAEKDAALRERETLKSRAAELQEERSEGLSSVEAETQSLKARAAELQGQLEAARQEREHGLAAAAEEKQALEAQLAQVQELGEQNVAGLLTKQEALQQECSDKAEEIAQLGDRIQASEALESQARAAQLLEEKDSANSSAAAHRGQQAELDASERVAEDLRREVRTLLQEKESTSGRLAAAEEERDLVVKLLQAERKLKAP